MILIFPAFGEGSEGTAFLCAFLINIYIAHRITKLSKTHENLILIELVIPLPYTLIC